MPLTLKKFLLYNFINITILLTPWIVAIIIALITLQFVAVCIFSFLLLLFSIITFPFIYMSAKSLKDIQKQEFVNLHKIEVERITSWGRFSGITINKSYIFELFDKNYTHALTIHYYENDVLHCCVLFIKEKELRKIGFYNYFKTFYSYKEKHITRKRKEKVYMNVSFYKHSGIVNSIKFIL